MKVNVIYNSEEAMQKYFEQNSSPAQPVPPQ